MDIINIALIGAGRAGRFHLNSLNKTRLFNLKYIVDLDLSKAIELSNDYHVNQESIKVITDINIPLQDKSIKAIIIASGTQTHYTLTKICLNNHKHVFCEKPLGNNEEEIKECYKIAKNNNLKLFIGYQKRFDTNYDSIYQEIKNTNGKIKNIKSFTRDYPLPPLEYLKTSNGIVEDMISHDIDIINKYIGFKEPKKVVAFYYTHDEKLKEINEIEDIEILMKYEDGLLVSINGSRKCDYGYCQRMEVSFNDKQLKFENKKNSDLTILEKNGQKTSQINESFKERYQEAYSKELEYFYKLITNKEMELEVKEYDLLLLKKITKAINLSIEENRIVYLDSLGNGLRKYIKGSPQYEFYVEQHKNQTYETVCKSIKKYSMLGRKKMKMKEALLLMDNFVDPSDPDVDLPNSVHAYQTAERIRKKHPLNYELQITGLIHDLGKILFEFGEPNWNVVGDTFALGCKFPETIILYDTLKENPDYNNPKHNSENGIYELNCGIKNLKLAFGHDEYLYIVLKNNYNHFLSDKYLNIIRFHSFYPWHTGNSYQHLEDETDLAMKNDIIDFNQYDLYSKEDTDFILTDEIKKYYDDLLDKYFPDDLLW